MRIMSLPQELKAKRALGGGCDACPQPPLPALGLSCMLARRGLRADTSQRCHVTNELRALTGGHVLRDDLNQPRNGLMVADLQIVPRIVVTEDAEYHRALTSRHVFQNDLNHGPQRGVAEGAARPVLSIHRVVLCMGHDCLQQTAHDWL